MDVATLMRQAASLNAHFTALITEDRKLTFAEAWARGARLANALRALGVKQGDRVAGLEDNNLACADLFLGCAIAGAVRVPLYPRNSRQAHRSMLDGTACCMVIADEAHAESVFGLEDELPNLGHVLVRDWRLREMASRPRRHRAGSPYRPRRLVHPPLRRHHPGTEGCGLHAARLGPELPKLGLLARAYAPRQCHRPRRPISHASGYLFLPAWLAGAANLLMGAFEPGKALTMMADHHVTHMFASPSLLASLARHPAAGQHDWRGPQSIMVGGAPITDATALLAREVFGDVLFQVFGQTEAVPLATMGPEGWFSDIEGSVPLRAAGRVTPFAQVEIRGPDGTVLPIGDEGEIVAKVEGQMRGYWGEENETKTRLINGWVHTKDIGRLDANGFLYVLDRADDMIVSGGLNIWPAELETVIADHPGVIEVAVFAIPDDRWGETPMAVVCVSDVTAVTREELIEMCRERLGSYKKPSRVDFTTEPLPKSVVGKLLRKELREPHWAGRDRRVAGA
jgi:acyl-CoA synthetase (AMP-forming)/AMP-acid ligase II